VSRSKVIHILIFMMSLTIGPIFQLGPLSAH